MHSPGPAFQTQKHKMSLLLEERGGPCPGTGTAAESPKSQPVSVGCPNGWRAKEDACLGIHSERWVRVSMVKDGSG